MAVLISRLPLAILLSLIASSTALTCPSGSRPLPPRSCIQLVTTPSAQATVCSNTADSDGPVKLTQSSQFDLLGLYAEVMGDAEGLYWIGHEFIAADNLGNISSDVNSTLLNSSNYGSENPGPSPGPGVCLAIGQDRALYRRDCTSELPAFCYQSFQAPNASLSIAGGLDRFVTLGSRINLTCEVSEGSEVTWRAAIGGSGPETVPEPDIQSFSTDDVGSYFCVASNPLGAYVSNAIVLVPSSEDMTSSEPVVTLTVSPTPVTFDTNVTLTCSYTSTLPVSNVYWFFNGSSVSETSSVSQSSSTLVVVQAQDDGYYQCFVRTENGNVASAGMLISLQAGTPREVDQISAIPNTQNSLIVTWLCPEYPNTHHISLLRYTVFYRPGFSVSTSQGESSFVPGLLPTLQDGSESSTCLAEMVVPGLEVGTTYAVKVVATSPGGLGGEASNALAISTTFGDVPGLVSGLTVQRTADNKTVYAFWADLKTTLPVGTVAQYRIDYREAAKEPMSTVFHSAKFPYIVISNVINADSYQVRVSAGVVVQRSPVMLNYGEATAWKAVDGITTMVPPAPPTTGPLRTEPAAGAIAAGVTVAVLCFIVVIALIVTGLVCVFYKHKKRSDEDAVKFSSVKNTDPDDSETKE